MINPGSVAGQMPAGDDALIRRIQDLERAVKELAAQDVLRTAGLIAEPNRLTVQGELDVTGSEVVSGSLNVTGPMVVGGTLTLPAGIIGNAALANPVTGAVANASQSAVTLTATLTGYAACAVSIPTGFTQALIMAQSAATFDGAGGMIMQTRIQSTTGGGSAINNGSGFQAVASGLALSLTGLAGGTITASSMAATGGAASADFINTSMIVLFLR